MTLYQWHETLLLVGCVSQSQGTGNYCITNQLTYGYLQPSEGWRQCQRRSWQTECSLAWDQCVLGDYHAGLHTHSTAVYILQHSTPLRNALLPDGPLDGNYYLLTANYITLAYLRTSFKTV